MLEKLMTTEELSDRIKGVLKQKGRLPDIPDYGPGAYSPAQIKICEFDLKSNFSYGDSGGRTTSGGRWLCADRSRAETCLDLWMFICLMNRGTG